MQIPATNIPAAQPRPAADPMGNTTKLGADAVEKKQDTSSAASSSAQSENMIDTLA